MESVPLCIPKAGNPKWVIALRAASVIKFLPKRRESSSCTLVVDSHANERGIGIFHLSRLDVSVLVQQKTY
jgi:hypothetical protein